MNQLENSPPPIQPAATMYRATRQLSRLLALLAILVTLVILMVGQQRLLAKATAVSETPCLAGLAGGFPCQDVNLLSFMSLADVGAGPGEKAANVWGWTDPVTTKEYVLLGLTDKMTFIDASDPLSPTVVGFLPNETITNPLKYRDVKVYQHYAFIIADEQSHHGLQVFDLNQLRDVVTPTVTFSATATYDQFGNAHNLFINEETGYAYIVRNTAPQLCSGAVYMLNIQDPLNPAFAGCYDSGGAASDTMCVVYNGPDTVYQGHELCLVASDDEILVADVTNKNAPATLATLTYPDIRRAHLAWLTDDHRYFVSADMNDEMMLGFNTRIFIWDFTQVATPTLKSIYTGPTPASDHNVWVRDDYAYIGNFRAGVRILDLHDIANSTLSDVTVRQAAFFDIYPANDNTGHLGGAWAVYPYFDSGVIAVSDKEAGLYLLRPVAAPGALTLDYQWWLVKKRLVTLFLIVLLSLLLTAVFAAAIAPEAAPNAVTYSTLLGANAAEFGRAIAVDAAGNMYVTGETQSTLFPTATHPLAPAHGIDVYLAKFDPDTGAANYILWFNALTLFAEDYGYSIAVGSDGSAYLTGETRSSDFCAFYGSVPGYDTTYNDAGDAFVLKVKPDGSGLAYCTYLGGVEADTGRSIAIDAAANAYVIGSTWSDVDFPTTAGAFDTSHNGLRDTFVVKLDASGTNLLYSTFLGGTGQEEGIAVAVDARNQAHLTGWTFSSTFPTTTLAYDPDFNGSADVFVAALNAGGSDLVYATFLGSDGEDRPLALALDAAGGAHVTGYTYSTDFPTTPGAWDRVHNGTFDGFVTQLLPDGSDVVHSTLLGGSAEDWISGIDLDATGNAYLTGLTWSADFPTSTTALDGTLSGGRDGFVTILSAQGSQLPYSSFLGGDDWDEGMGIVTDGAGNIYVSGATRSPNFPTTANAYDLSLGGDYDIFASRLEVLLETPRLIYLPAIQR